MTEQWFEQDIARLIKHRGRVVVLDPHEQCGFVLPLLKKQEYVVLQTDGSLHQSWQMMRDEMMLRYEAETTYKDRSVVFYTTRPQEKLSFLFDYCFTHGCLDLNHPQDWLKKKIFTHTALQVSLDNPALLSAAKLGIGKDLVWWKKIVQDLQEMIDLDEEMLPFLHAPEAYLAEKEADIRRLFEEKAHFLIGQPYLPKPAGTLANEIVRRMLDGLANNEISNELLQLYYKWADSTLYRPSLETYIRNYRLTRSSNPWNAHPDHCFKKLDEIALRQIAENCRDRAYVLDKLHKLDQRIFFSKVPLFVASWWKDIWILFNTDVDNMTGCTGLQAFIEYYTGTFSRLDRAIRKLYEHFLNMENIIRPLQEQYERLNHQLLQIWFACYPEYKSDQQGFLPGLLARAKPGTAVIVGDGVRYEIADYVASNLPKDIKVDREVMLADLPSETEHNMSALYAGKNEVLPLQKEREARLTASSGKEIMYLGLEQLHYGIEADYLILTYKDIDKVGETLQQNAIKLFSEFESTLVEKISLLLNMGYEEVYLITDHGFVLTGLLDESDKIDPDATGKKQVHERFIRTVEKQANNDWICIERPYEDFRYVCVAKNHRPFKSKGVYGYAHGGVTPQEIILPRFRFTRQKPITSSLNVAIINKKELTDVAGELFVIRLEAEKNAADLFAAQRKIQVKLFAGDKEYQSSTILTLEAGNSGQVECTFNKHTQVQAILLDAITQEQLDKVTVKKSNLRDLGGL